MGNITFKSVQEDTKSVMSKIKSEYRRSKRESKRNKQIFQSQAMTWDSPKVAAWLDFLGLVTYARTFLKHGVDGPTLLQLSDDQIMRGLNVTKKTHVYSLTSAIADLQESNVDYDSWEWTNQGVQKWLAERGLDTLCAKFAEEGVHGGVLFRMTQEEFVNEVREHSCLILCLHACLSQLECLVKLARVYLLLVICVPWHIYGMCVHVRVAWRRASSVRCKMRLVGDELTKQLCMNVPIRFIFPAQRGTRHKSTCHREFNDGD
jgi:hypothetical protein